jgi:hypothetical protein
MVVKGKFLMSMKRVSNGRSVIDEQNRMCEASEMGYLGSKISLKMQFP